MEMKRDAPLVQEPQSLFRPRSECMLYIIPTGIILDIGTTASSQSGPEASPTLEHDAKHPESL